ncbi:MAG: DEAD/DEAH box helicase [Rubrivivax sp.]|nr:MAG: DEAD/DEAH box helicase [Rubrivivax sp.]
MAKVLRPVWPLRSEPLARPGPRWGHYPERPDHAEPRHSGTLPLRGLASPLPASWRLALCRPWLRQVRQAADRPSTPLNTCRQALRREGLTPDTVAQALAHVLRAAHSTLGLRLHDTQLLAATLMLDQQLVEMATGEGKTLAMAAAAAVAALAGIPVHVVTANDYLAERDAQHLTPLFQALGVSVASIAPAMAAEQRRAVYAHDVVYTTAKEVAFDYLRDGLSTPHGAPPLLRGLSLALIDEADSILLDEASVPLIISVAQAGQAAQQAHRRAVWWQALHLARRLHAGDDFSIDTGRHSAALTAAGEQHIAGPAEALGGVWRRSRLRRDLLGLALTALHALHRDQHYLVRDGKVELLDTLTGRVAVGRVWSQGLQTLIELKEGCTPSAPTETLAQITFQRFFKRYWRLGGLSGTLVEARAELRSLYDVDVVRVPERLPSQRQRWPTLVFAHADDRWRAVAERARDLQAQGRPTLIGTDSVHDSEQLSTHLHQAGIAHAVLNARHDQHEADIVAQAGQAGRVTVATRMAGRGTDIGLDERALAAGGLHVIHCQRNESKRMDRQLVGRSARQGQPGSTEAWICASISPDPPPPSEPKLTRCIQSAVVHRFPLSAWCFWHLRLPQWVEERRQVALRRQLLERDRQWAQQFRLARQSRGPSA